MDVALENIGKKVVGASVDRRVGVEINGDNFTVRVQCYD